MKSIRWKLIILYLAIVFIVMIIAGTYLILSLEATETERLKSRLSEFANRINDEVVLLKQEETFNRGLADVSQRYGYEQQLQGCILDGSGVTVASVISPFPEYKNSAIVSALTGTASFYKSWWAQVPALPVRYWLCYAMPIMQDNEVRYVIFVQADTQIMTDNLLRTAGAFFVTVIISLILAGILGFIFANTLTGPIAVLTRRAKELAGGRLFQEIEVRSEDEIGQLSRSFNHMARELTTTMSVITSEKNKMEVILHNMTDGVLAFDQRGLLIHTNTKSCEMLEMQESEMSLVNVLDKFNLTIDDVNNMVMDEIMEGIYEKGRQVVKGSIIKYYNLRMIAEGVVMVLQDITEQKRLDDMRKEFVANVSHELRTPLTTVKSYAETLADGAIEDRELAMEFLRIIDGETDRMTILVKDLLQLSRMDNKQLQLEYETVDLFKFIEDNVQQNKIHAQQKNQELRLNPSDSSEPMSVRIDINRMNQVVSNIIINSIKYSDENTEIMVYFGETDKFYRVYVEDKGVGIPQNDLLRIFERFYRVDKARSRAMGGTGLGLSIAKEIMIEHGGDITVESEYGKGTIMTLWFPKNTHIGEMPPNTIF